MAVFKVGSHSFDGRVRLYNALRAPSSPSWVIEVYICAETHFPTLRIVHFYNVFMQLIKRYFTNYLLALTCLWKGCKWDTRSAVLIGAQGEVEGEVSVPKIFHPIYELLVYEVIWTSFLVFHTEVDINVRERMMVNVSPFTDPPLITHKFYYIFWQLTSTDSRRELGPICSKPPVNGMVRFRYNLLIPADRPIGAICDTRFIFCILSLFIYGCIKVLDIFTPSVAYTLPLN